MRILWAVLLWVGFYYLLDKIVLPFVLPLSSEGKQGVIKHLIITLSAIWCGIILSNRKKQRRTSSKK